MMQTKPAPAKKTATVKASQRLFDIRFVRELAVTTAGRLAMRRFGARLFGEIIAPPY
jgi:hypothetical protein